MGRGGDIIKTIQNESGAQIKVTLVKSLKEYEKLYEIIRRFTLADDALPLMSTIDDFLRSHFFVTLFLLPNTFLIKIYMNANIMNTQIF